MIKAIVFDIGNVLIHFDHMIPCRRLETISGVACEEIRSFIYDTELSNKFETGKITAESFFSEVINKFGFNLSVTELAEIWEDIFSENKPVTELVPLLHGKYRLLVLSNTDSVHFEYLQKKYEVFALFNEFILSYEVGARKPDKKIFLEAVKRSGHSADECLYIDDLAEFTQIADSLGIRCITYQDPKTLKMKMEQEGVLFE